MRNLSKQDRGMVRSAQDLEKKYDFSSLISVKKNVELQAEELTKTNATLNEFVDTVVDMSTKLDRTVKSVDVMYALGDSTTTAPTEGWQTQAPQWQDGKYMWQKTITVYADGDIVESKPTCIAGATGKDGTSVNILGSYETVEDLKAAHPTGNTGDAYIITGDLYVWTENINDWSNVGTIQGPQGEQGIQGDTGADGRTSYLHIKYSNDNGKTFTENDGETVGSYIGQYVDFTEADSTDVSKYKWAKIEGEIGETGTGVKEIKEQYYLSTSNTSQTGGQWKETQDLWQEGKYIWTRSKITWTDDTISYTTPVLANGINNANNMANQAINNQTLIGITEEGKEFYLTDSADSNCKTVEIFGESTQETRSGKNLLFWIRPTFGTITENDDGSFNFNYNYANNLSMELTGKLTAGTYTISNYGDIVMYVQSRSDDYNSSVNAKGGTRTFTYDGTSYLRLLYGATTVSTTQLFKVQLEKGTQATEYEPYGAMPSPEFPSEIESVSGKNLLPFNDKTFTLNGITYTCSKGELTLNGTSVGETTATNNNFKTNFKLKLPAGTYTFQLNLDNLISIYTSAQIRKISDNTNLASVTGHDTKKVTFTLNEDTEVYLGFYVYEKTFDNITLNIQLEKGSNATYYVPYNHIGYKSVGKNLYNIDNNWLYYNAVVCQADLKDGKTYTVKINSPDTSKSYQVKGSTHRQGYTNFGGLLSSSNNYTYTFTYWTVPNNQGQINGVIVWENGVTTELTLEQVKSLDIQIEEGTVATDYELYKETITTIPLLHKMRSLPNRVADEIKNINGKWYDIQRVGLSVFNGSESWGYSANNTAFYITSLANLIKKPINNSTILAISNYFKGETANHCVSNTYDYCIGFNTIGSLWLRYNAFTTVGELKTWLSENNTEVVYELAEPIITEITDLEMINALENIRTFKNITHITADAPSILTYYRDTSFAEEFENIKNKMTSKVTTWYYSGVPTISNLPASSWTTEALKKEHVNDLYYDKDTGYAYIFAYSGSEYYWEEVKDKDLIEALATANAAKDTADNKRRVFIANPEPPYDNGDLWVNDGEIYICQISKPEGETFAEGDFVVGTKYTDDTYAKQVGDNLTVLEGTVLEIQKGVDEYKIQFDTTIKTIQNDTKEHTEALETMSYSFGTKDLAIANSNDPVNTRINNQGLKVYTYNDLETIVNHNGLGTNKLIVVGESQIANMRIMKTTDENGDACSDFHHLVSNFQVIEDLE